MATRILSNFSSAKSKLIPKFLKESRFFSVLKEQQNSNKLKLVVSRRHKGFNLISIGDNDKFTDISWHHRYDDLCPDASCNNKLLLRSWNRTALWNPTIGEIKILPQSSVPPYDHHFLFDGFGFDPNAAASEDYDYKVIRMINYDRWYEENNYQVEIYSTQTDSWKLFPCPAQYVTLIKGPTLYINGSYYWPALYWREYNRAYVILRFDFATEMFSSAHIPLPDIYKLRGESSNFIIAEFEGSLAVVAYSLADELAVDEKPFKFEIWVWNDESLSWAKRAEWAFSAPRGVSGVERPLGLFNNDQLYLRDFMGELVLFDCATGELKNLGLKSDQTDHYGPMSIFAYVESSAEEAKHGENEEKMKIGTLSNSTTFISKLAPIVIDSKQKPNKDNKKLRLMFGHDFDGTLYLSQISPTNNNSSNDSDNSNVLFNFPRLGAHFIPAASCSSALLLCFVDSDCRAALWNPTTDEVKKLPDDLSPSRVFRSVWYGFGFDPKADEGDYKVIRFIQNRNGNLINTTQAELYSLKADSWKNLASSFSYDNLYTEPSLYINGFCYWVVSTLKSGYIVSFNFANELFSSAPHIPLPPRNDGKSTLHNRYLLAEFHGSLAALVFTSFDHFLEIWVWNNDESSPWSSWTRVSVIHVPVEVEKPLGLFGNDQLYLQGLNGEVLLFDCAKGGGELKRLGLNVSGLRFDMVNWGKLGRDCIFPYVESSFPLNGKKIVRASHKIIND